MIVNLARMGGKNADVSYYTAWGGIWAFAEISFGITVTGTILLPKFIESEGTKLRGVFSSLTRPFTSLKSGGSFGILMESEKGTTAAQEVTLDTIGTIGYSESDVGSTNRGQDMERYPSNEGVHDPTKHPSVNATETLRRFGCR